MCNGWLWSGLQCNLHKIANWNRADDAWLQNLSPITDMIREIIHEETCNHYVYYKCVFNLKEKKLKVLSDPHWKSPSLFHLKLLCPIFPVQYLFFDLITCIMIRTEEFFTIISKLLETILWCIYVTLIQKGNKINKYAHVIFPIQPRKSNTCKKRPVINQPTILCDDTSKIQCNKLLKKCKLTKTKLCWHD